MADIEDFVVDNFGSISDSKLFGGEKEAIPEDSRASSHHLIHINIIDWLATEGFIVD